KIKHVIAVSEIVSKSDISDIRILEEAVPAVYPESSMRKVLAGVGGIIGFILSLIFIFLPELLDFRVKSAKEIANILKIKSIGMLPNEDECRKNKHEFYEGLQVFLENINISLKGTEIPISVFCSSISETGKSFIINLFSEFLINRKMKVLYIDSVNEITDDIKENTINNFIYSNDSNIAECKVNKISESLDKMYFNLDDDTYRYPLEKAKLKQFFDIQKKKYDHIIVELFPFHDNRQLFSSFTAIADINVLVSRFRKSGKFSDKTLVDFINEYKSSNIVSLVNSVEYHYYKYLK
ncbi:MAG: hypothetical protein GY756_17095, partial [bacterium]|nr:hypothetical protein [bacterium]